MRLCFFLPNFQFYIFAAVWLKMSVYISKPPEDVKDLNLAITEIYDTCKDVYSVIFDSIVLFQYCVTNRKSKSKHPATWPNKGKTAKLGLKHKIVCFIQLDCMMIFLTNQRRNGQWTLICGKEFRFVEIFIRQNVKCS